jgi:tRNA (guanine26-N2/guanine27-N2)-dimethyltransferase
MDVDASPTTTAEQPHQHVLREGKGAVVFNTQNEVFYNPVQEFNRDMSVLAIQQYTDGWWARQHAMQRKRQRNYATRAYGGCRV